jgi:nucleoside-diphosphate-sugar epimerase
MKILITGGMGYVGTPLTQYLLGKGYNVSVIDKLLFNNGQLNLVKSKKFKFYKFDILNKQKLNLFFKKNEFDVIIHLAAIVGDPASKINKKLTIDTNLKASKTIYNLAKKKDIKKFIFFSTCSNYGLSKNLKLLKETDKLKPLSLYAKTKVDFEKFLLKDKSKIQKIILRISTLYGISPRMRFDLTINEFIKKVFSSEHFDIYHADTWRPYLNLKDLNLIVGKILSKKNLIKKKYVFNTGYSEENYTKRDIIKNISKIFKKKKQNYEFVDNNHFDKRNYKVNFSKIKLLDVKKTISIKKGIREILNYLDKNKNINFEKKVFYNHK